MTVGKPESTKVITFEGQEIPLVDLPEDVQALVGFYDTWNEEKSIQQVKLHKTVCAMSKLQMDIGARVKQHLTPASTLDVTDAADDADVVDVVDDETDNAEE